MSTVTRTLLLACALTLAATTHAASSTDKPTAHPDFSGVWLPNSKESGHWPQERPFTKKLVDLRAQWDKTYQPMDLTVDDDHTSCLPYTLPFILTTITQYPFEIVSTPRRMYVFTEVYGQIRRIDFDAPPAPPDTLPTRTGTSRAHWEGSQLVIESTNIVQENEGSRFPSSPALRVTERLSLQEGGEHGKQIVNEITVQDPLVYEKPVTIRMVYKWAKDVTVSEYICEQDLWDQHLDGGTSKIPWR